MTTKPVYMLVTRQAGGCDYTIGCGTAIETLQSQAESAALIEATQILVEGDEHSPVGSQENALTEAFVVAMVAKLPLAELRAGIKAKLDEADRKAAEARERHEYERLKKRFGEKP